LESHQRIRSWSVWPEEDFPRTPSTWKIRRHKVARRVAGRQGPQQRKNASSARRILAQLTGRGLHQFQARQRLDEDLGLSSLDRVDLLSRLEDVRDVELDEESMVRINTVGELEAALSGSAAGGPGRGEEEGPSASLPQDRLRTEFPCWTRRTAVRWARNALREGLMLPLLRNRLPLTVTGTDRLDDLRPPVIFAANHASHLDTPVILAALPPAWRPLLVPAMVQERFLPKNRVIIITMNSGIAVPTIACRTATWTVTTCK
jgi:long-chain acyl-CoA synthetase